MSRMFLKPVRPLFSDSIFAAIYGSRLNQATFFPPFLCFFDRSIASLYLSSSNVCSLSMLFVDNNICTKLIQLKYHSFMQREELSRTWEKIFNKQVAVSVLRQSVSAFKKFKCTAPSLLYVQRRVE